MNVDDALDVSSVHGLTGVIGSLFIGFCFSDGSHFSRGFCFAFCWVKAPRHCDTLVRRCILSARSLA